MSFTPIKVWENVTADIFQQEIMPLSQPAILKGLVADWPIVTAAKQGSKPLFDYLTKEYIGGDVPYVHVPHKEKGVFFYDDSMERFNFTRKQGPLTDFFDQVLANSQKAEPDSVALQSAPVHQYFPDFNQQNPLNLFHEPVQPRFWLGNQSVVKAHHDNAENIACLVSGKRRFTLFPPEQIDNLYLGPIDFTPAGAAVSIPDVNNPDLTRFPKFAQALEVAVVGELEPGDAIYIPSLWWHQVESLGKVNMLVNYWQGGSIANPSALSALDLLAMGMLTVRELPQAQKDAWRAFFDYYIFSEQTEKHDHIPESKKGLLAPLNSTQKMHLKKRLKRQLS